MILNIHEFMFASLAKGMRQTHLIEYYTVYVGKGSDITDKLKEKIKDTKGDEAFSEFINASMIVMFRTSSEGNIEPDDVKTKIFNLIKNYLHIPETDDFEENDIITINAGTEDDSEITSPTYHFVTVDRIIKGVK